MRSSSGEVDGVAVAAVLDRNDEGAALMADPNRGAAGQPWMSGGNTPVLIGLAAVGRASVERGVIDGGGYCSAMATAVMGQGGLDE